MLGQKPTSCTPIRILTMLKIFKGKYNERLWFDVVMNEMKSLPGEKRIEEMDSNDVDVTGSDKENSENVGEHEKNEIVQEVVE